MARDMGRGIIAPDNNDNIGTGASEMRTLAATTAAAITDVDRRAGNRLTSLESVASAHSQELTEVMQATGQNRLDLERLETEGIEGHKGDPGEPGPGGSIALEETDPGCFVDSEITWMQWPQSGGLPSVWNPNTQSYENPIRVDTSVGTRVFVGDVKVYDEATEPAYLVYEPLPLEGVLFNSLRVSVLSLGNIKVVSIAGGFRHEGEVRELFNVKPEHAPRATRFSWSYRDNLIQLLGNGLFGHTAARTQAGWDYIDTTYITDRT